VKEIADGERRSSQRRHARAGDVVSPGDKTVAATRPDERARIAQDRPVPRPQAHRSLPGYLRDTKPSVKQVARLTIVTARLPTSPVRMLPGFLIVGAQRCGTTSMARTLDEHPAVFGSVLQEEVHYFDNAYHRGLSWYRSHFPLTAVARRAAHGAEVNPVAYESSPYYMFHPWAGERIARDLPGVRLIVLLRDPVERAYSAHAHEVAHGFETEPFERALELEASRLNGQRERIEADPSYFSYSHQHHSYRARGQYAEQLERLEQLFGRERLLVVDSGDFFADPQPAYDRVLAFLGLPNRGYPDFKVRNARPRSAPMSKSVRAELEEHFRPHDERLAAWLGHEPSWRRG
jgi:Sulfotransferase domain